MSIHAMKRLLREWAALIAVFAMVLGPLALATSRGLGAAEKGTVAAGSTPIALCLPGMAEADPAKAPMGGDCDHCTPAQAFVLTVVDARPGVAQTSTLLAGPTFAPHGLAFPRAPPARAPPTA